MERLLAPRQRVKYASAKLLIAVLTIEIILNLLGWWAVREELSAIFFFFTVAVAVLFSVAIGIIIGQRSKNMQYMQQQGFQETLVIKLKSATVDLMLIVYMVSWLGIGYLVSRVCISLKPAGFFFLSMNPYNSCNFTGHIVRNIIAGLGLGILFWIHRSAGKNEKTYSRQVFLEIHRLRKWTIGDFAVVGFFIYIIALLLYRLLAL
ncbi:hypothetical protein JYT87_02815 [Nitrospira defluvii]|nr:hypothetical protein [Nitrospira defluvii]